MKANAAEPGKSMDLPVNPPVLPMLAKRIDKLPTGSEWIYEPKWDGFLIVEMLKYAA